MKAVIRRTGRVAVALILALLVALVQPAVARADGVETTLTVTPQAFTDGKIVATGTLKDASGQPVANATIIASLDGETLGYANTAADGSLSMQFTVPAAKLSGTRQIIFSFAGSGSYKATTHLQAVDYTAGGASSGTAPAQSPAGTRGTKLELSLASGTTTPGDVLQVSGSLATVEGNPISGAAITFTVGGADVPSGATATDTSGKFEAFLDIDKAIKPGDAPVVATFAGGGELMASSATQALTVELPGAAASATPTESATASPTASATASASAAPTATASAAPTAAAPRGGLSTTNLFIIGGVVLASGVGIALLVAALRPRRKPVAVDEEVVGLIGEADEVEIKREPVNWEDISTGDQFFAAPVPDDMEGAAEFAPPASASSMPGEWFRERPARAPRAAAPIESMADSTEVRDDALPRRAAF